MRFPSLAVGFAVPSLLAAALAMGGCFGDAYNGPETGGAGGSGGGTQAPRTLDIDTDAILTAKGGAGVGIFFEYATGGLWTVYTTCDTTLSQDPCDIDVFVAPVDPSATITNVDGKAFQGMDEVDVDQTGIVHMFVETTIGLDGMTFTGTPGAAMEFDVYLDGAEQPQFLYWVGDGVLHTGSPTDPVNLAPVAGPLDGGTDSGTGSGGAGGGGTGGGGGSADGG
jgi:hypothetical protein